MTAKSTTSAGKLSASAAVSPTKRSFVRKETIKQDIGGGKFENVDIEKLDWREMFLQEKMEGEPQTIPQSVIYELVNETINVDAYDISFPKSGSNKKEWFYYFFLSPLTHIQYITIPDPLSLRNKNFYPLSLFMSIIWIFLYSYIIVWFTYEMSSKMNLNWSMIPMFIYPIGISLRDRKKFQDFKLCLETFKRELPDQEITLAETYAPQIF